MGAQAVIGVSVGFEDGNGGVPTNIFQVVSRAVSVAQKHQLELWERHADLVLRPDVQSLAWDDFARADEAIEAGAVAARRALPRLEKLLERAAEAEFPMEARLFLEQRSDMGLKEVQA
jgi:predicted acylesterase/phospholipase RssA